MSVTALPVLNLGKWHDGPEGRSTFLARLRAAARDFGFFYLVGHVVPQDLIDAVLKGSRDFFALPDADKLEIEMVNSPHFRGYNRVGQERTKGQRDCRL